MTMMRTMIFDIRCLIYIGVCGFIGSALAEGQDQCSTNLVTGPHGVNDEQISASSVLPVSEIYTPKNARLHSLSEWVAGSENDEYIQVDFDDTNRVLAVQTQGAHDFDGRVTSYAVSYSLDNKAWTSMKSNGVEKIFPGNNDRDTVVTNVLPEVVMARHFRINPRTYNLYISLRFDLIGCNAHLNSWNVHPIAITDFRDSLWNKSASHMGKCAIYCYIEATCQSFVFNGDTGTCTGFKQEFLHGYRLHMLQGNLYYLRDVSLARYTTHLNDCGYTSADNVIYKIYTDQVDITSAQTRCKNNDTDLLAVQNLAVLNTLQRDTMIKGLFNPFVSGSLVEGKWVYSNGAQIPVNLWADKEPSDNNGKCVMITKTGLRVASCLTHRTFMCGF